MLLHVDGCKLIFARYRFGDDDGVLVVVPFPAHEGAEEVLAQGEFARVCGGAIRERVARRHPLAASHNGAVVDAGTLVGAEELLELVGLFDSGIVVDGDGVAGDGSDHPFVLCEEDLS